MSKQGQIQHSLLIPVVVDSCPLFLWSSLADFLFVTMIAFSLLSLFLAAPTFGQIVYDSGHNVTNIVGTWSSGSQNVVTGSVSLYDTPMSLSLTL